MADEVRFGIVGAGMISHYHAQAIANTPGARLVSVMSSGEKRRNEFAAKFGVRGYGDMDTFLADPELDAVAIATPTGAHLEPALAAAKAKKHVLCEKPLETTPARAQQIIDACKQAGVVLAPIFQYRCTPAAQIMRRALDKGRFGKILIANARIKWFRTQEYYDSGAWRGTWAMDGGGVLTNQSIHALDLFLWFAGKPVEAYGYTQTVGHERIEVEDNAAAVVKFANGAFGLIEASTCTAPGWPLEIEISGSRGTGRITAQTISKWDFVDEDPIDAEAKTNMEGPTVLYGANDPSSISADWHTIVVGDMVATILRGENRVIGGAEAKLPIELIHAIYESARTGKPTPVGA